MRCEDCKDVLLDLAASPNVSEAELPPHLRECASCAAEFARLRETMQLLDQWTVPEPSPYFDTKLKARLREEAVRPAGWRAAIAASLRHLRVPALAAAAVAAGFTGYTIYQHEQAPTTAHVQQASGSGVTDLQTLDKQYQVLNELESLDDSASTSPDVGL